MSLMKSWWNPQLPRSYRIVMEYREAWAAMRRWLGTSRAAGAGPDWASVVSRARVDESIGMHRAWFQFPNRYREEIYAGGELGQVSGSDGERMWWYHPGRSSPPTQPAPSVLLQEQDEEGRPTYIDITDEVGAGTSIFHMVLNEMLEAYVLIEDFDADRLRHTTLDGRQVVIAEGLVNTLRDGMIVHENFVPADRHVIVTDLETGMIVDAISYGGDEILSRYTITEFEPNWTPNASLFALPPSFEGVGHVADADNAKLFIAGDE